MSPNTPRPLTFAILLLVAVTLKAQAQTTHSRRTNLTARQIAQRTLPSVVVLFAKNSGTNTVSLGTGFFVDTNVIATNYHVVRNASRISAKLISQKRTFEISEIIGWNIEKDLALLRVEGISVKALVLGNTATLRIGDEIYVVGNPEGFEGTFSQGIISGFRGSSYIQITAAISHGSSGGPVLNARGEVIGIAVGAINEGQNLNFAISSSELAGFRKLTMRERVPSARASDVPPVRKGRIPTADEYLLSKGNEYYQRELYAKAAQEYQAAIRQNPDSAEAYYRLGSSYVKLSKNLDAIEAYKTAIDLGNVYENLPSEKEAIQAYGEVVGPGPGNDLAEFLTGEAYLKRCWNITARRKYTVLRFLKSGYASRLREDVELHQCELDLSGIDVDELRPETVLTATERIICKGDKYYEGKFFASAAEQYKAAISIDANLAGAHYRLGNSYVERSRYSDAVAEYKIAIALGDVYKKLPGTQRAIHAYEKLVAYNAYNDIANFLLGEARLKNGTYEKAVRKYRILRALNSSYSNQLLRDIEKHGDPNGPNLSGIEEISDKQKCPK